MHYYGKMSINNGTKGFLKIMVSVLFLVFGALMIRIVIILKNKRDPRTYCKMLKSLLLFEFYLFVNVKLGFTGNNIGLRVKTAPDALLLTWPASAQTPDQWNVVYSVLGTNYHSAIILNGTQTSTNIQTENYPGMMFAVQLYAVTNGTKSLVGRTAYARSRCTNELNATIGESYTVTSKGYPTYQQRGAICDWIFNGDDVTWYRIDVIDIDLNTNESICNNYVEIPNGKLCGNKTTNGTHYVTEPNMQIRHVTSRDDGKRGFKLYITAIHMTDAPFNVTAYINDILIKVTWFEPVHHPTNFTYTLRIHNVQQQTENDVTVPGNQTFYLLNYRTFAGQTFVFRVHAASDGLASDFSESVEVKTSCDQRIHLKPTKSIELTSARYPFGYLQGILCKYQIQTDNDFIIRIETSDIDITGGDSLCRDTYLQLGVAGKFCRESPPDKIVVIQDSEVDVVFKSNYESTRGKGFNVTVASVSKPPSEPTHVTSKITPETINVHWRPPNENQQYVSGYTIEYFIIPDTAGGVIHVGHDVTDVNITTSEHPGHLYTIRVAASTAGGQGPFARPLFARSACGSKHRLTRKQTIAISTDSFSHDVNYQPGTICQWNIKTDPLLWLRIDVGKLDIELAPNCSKDFLRISSDLVLCGEMDSKTLLVEKSSIDMMFSSDFNNTAKGFKLTISAIGPKPGSPRQLSAIPMQYGIYVTWRKPEYFHQFVTGYLVSYRFRGDTRNNTVRVDKEDNSCILDMTSFPGRLVEIWLKAAGDMINSNSTETTLVRNECGNTFNISKSRDPFYISSPYQNIAVTGNVYCKWTVVLNPNIKYKIRFIQYSVNNANSCDSAITINGNMTVCNGSLEGSDLDLPLGSSVTIEMNVLDTGFLNFLLEMYSQPVISDRSSNTERISSSSAPAYSSTSVAVLFTSIVSSFVASSSWKTSESSEYQTNNSSHDKHTEEISENATHDVNTCSTHIAVASKKINETSTDILGSGDSSTMPIRELYITHSVTIDIHDPFYGNKDKDISLLKPSTLESLFEVDKEIRSTATLDVLPIEIDSDVILGTYVTKDSPTKMASTPFTASDSSNGDMFSIPVLNVVENTTSLSNIVISVQTSAMVLSNSEYSVDNAEVLSEVNMTWNIHPSTVSEFYSEIETVSEEVLSSFSTISTSPVHDKQRETIYQISSNSGVMSRVTSYSIFAPITFVVIHTSKLWH